MKKVQSAFVLVAGCVAVSLFTGCAGPKGFSVRAPENPVLNYAGVPYDDAWKDLVAFMEGDAKWCMGSIEDMSKADGYVRTSWRASCTGKRKGDRREHLAGEHAFPTSLARRQQL